jgi:hypothetical protein
VGEPADPPVIGADSYTIEATTPEIIQQKVQARLNRPWIPIAWDATTELKSYDNMCAQAGDCLKAGKKYGSKSANLGFMANRNVLGRASQTGSYSKKLGYDLVPFGFGVPLQYYVDFVNYPANSALKAKIDNLITREKSGLLSGGERKQLVADVQQTFYKAKFPPQMLAKINQMMQQVLPGIEKVKVRSSANAEDIENFDGAGLHDSFSAKPGVADNADQSCTLVDESEPDSGEPDLKMEPRTIQCAMKGVYASLWNKRALEERSFARIDHATVSMGVSVLPAYDYQSDIKANSVLVTRVINSSDIFGYSVSLQKKNNTVTNPSPGTFSEISVAAIGLGNEPTTLTYTRFAKPKKDEPQLTAPLLTQPEMLQMVEIARRVEEAYCRYKPGYYNDDCQFVSIDAAKPKALDYEFKYLKNGHWVAKQCREFGGH